MSKNRELERQERLKQRKQLWKTTSEPGISPSVIAALLEAVDQNNKQRHAGKVVEVDGEVYTVVMDYKKRQAMIVRGDYSPSTCKTPR